MNKVLIGTLCAVVAASCNLFSQITIDNFDSYDDTAALQANWGSFGSGAQAGAPTLAEDAGVSGTNAALFALTWNVGNNANMQMVNVPSAAQSLDVGDTIDVTLYIVTRAGFDPPTNPTLLKLAIEGTNSVIWQTTTVAAATVNSATYQTISFSLNETDMSRTSAAVASLSDTLASIDNIRLRFENTEDASTRQDVYVDDIIVAAVPEAGQYASFIAIGALIATVVYRRRGRRQE